MPEPTDQHITGRALAGDGPAFRHLVEKHQGFVYRLAYRFVGTVGDADALVAFWAAAGASMGNTDNADCVRSAIVDVTADLIDFNVNQNAWISSMLLYKLGLFGLEWDKTPWFDNKAAFQRGVNQAIRRTAVELVDALADFDPSNLPKGFEKFLGK